MEYARESANSDGVGLALAIALAAPVVAERALAIGVVDELGVVVGAGVDLVLLDAEVGVGPVASLGLALGHVVGVVVVRLVVGLGLALQLHALHVAEYRVVEVGGVEDVEEAAVGLGEGDELVAGEVRRT